MSHNEKRGHWIKEGLLSFGTGISYGITVVASAHPFDTIKTKMQAQVGFENASMYRTFIRIVKAEGVKGLYRGCVPPLWGSGLYRSLQFSGFEGTYTLLDNNFGRAHIPFTNGLEVRVIIAGIWAGTVRSIVETPLEYAKIKRQMGQTWHLKDCHRGAGITWTRSVVLLPTFFIILDSFRRHFDGFFRNNLMGPFLASGCSSVLAWWICWPLELVKSQVQGGYLHEKHMTTIQRIKFIVKERGGILGLYRGIGPGSVRSFIGNGTGMVIMQIAQRKVTEWGLRD